MSLIGPLRYESPPNLPPLSAAPILEHYDLKTKRIKSDLQLIAPVDDRGVVDIFATVEAAMSLVDPSYIWPRDEPEPDIHHFVWERELYLPRQHGGDCTPNMYREIPFHKGYLPRQLHDFLHVVIAEPAIPDYEVMRKRYESYKSAKRLFKAAQLAISVERKPERLKGIDRSEDGELLIEQDILMEIIERMNSKVLHERDRITDDNEFLTHLDLKVIPLKHLTPHLGRVAAHDGVNLFPMVYGNRQAA